ncbi:hypothetical protein [Methylobacterium adhaesivum]|uniref:Uncharacterized protein n=1 Tax=Methylobacterium adhaesivum TaxID=333297 RepID=A0ABT8BBC6_9HYPH|nr:hypothetical protein [Methylobacterium adhaesivum]MDN3589353.1 hypothetical protein [Methylobacterium adhaesivum]
MSTAEIISLIANITQIIGFPVVIIAFYMQAQSLTKTRISVMNDVSERIITSNRLTGQIHEEEITVKCTNMGYFATALEHARFEVQFFDDRHQWNTLDVILADMDTELSMPIRIDVAETVKLRFNFTNSNLDRIRKNRVLFIQRFSRDKEEKIHEVSFSEEGFMFAKKTAQT